MRPTKPGALSAGRLHTHTPHHNSPPRAPSATSGHPPRGAAPDLTSVEQRPTPTAALTPPLPLPYRTAPTANAASVAPPPLSTDLSCHLPLSTPPTHTLGDPRHPQISTGLGLASVERQPPSPTSPFCSLYTQGRPYTYTVTHCAHAQPHAAPVGQPHAAPFRSRYAGLLPHGSPMRSRMLHPCATPGGAPYAAPAPKHVPRQRPTSLQRGRMLSPSAAPRCPLRGLYAAPTRSRILWPCAVPRCPRAQPLAALHRSRGLRPCSTPRCAPCAAAGCAASQSRATPQHTPLPPRIAPLRSPTITACCTPVQPHSAPLLQPLRPKAA